MEFLVLLFLLCVFMLLIGGFVFFGIGFVVVFVVFVVLVVVVVLLLLCRGSRVWVCGGN